MLSKALQHQHNTTQPPGNSNVHTVGVVVLAVLAADVCLEVVTLVAAVGAVRAGIGLLPSVGELVALQLVARLKGLGADGAGVAAAASGCCGRRASPHRQQLLERKALC